MACVGGKEWYFFSLRDRKYATGQRTNRATVSGYWKATGKDRLVTRRGVLVGMRKTLVFYQGRAPKGTKTDWVMHEFRMELVSRDAPKFSLIKEDWVLCRVFYKSRAFSSSKPSLNTKYEATSSSSLPPLTETYITFGHGHGHGQTPLILEGYNEQVPCFSNNPFIHNSMPAMERRSMMQIKNPGDDMNPGLSQLDDGGKKAIREVLNQLTGLEGNQKGDPQPQSNGEGSIDSYLSENVFSSSMW